MSVRHFKVLIEYDPEDKLWVTYVPALDHLSTFGETREEALERTGEAILGYLEAASKEGIPVTTDVSDLELVDIEIILDTGITVGYDVGRGAIILGNDGLPRGG